MTPQPDVQPVRCISPCIQPMPAHHTYHNRHHHAHLYIINPDAGNSSPHTPPTPTSAGPPPARRCPAQPRARDTRAEGGASADGRYPGGEGTWRGAGPQAGPARGAEGAQDWDRDWDAIPDPLGGEALPLVMEVYGWLGWARSGTTRGMRNRPFDAVLLRRDEENQEVPPRGGVGSPGGPREGPPGRDSGRVARQGANVAGFPGWGGAAPRHGRGGQQLAPRGPAHRPHPLALPPAEHAAAGAPAPTQAAAQVTAAPGGDGPGRWAQGVGQRPATPDTTAAGPGPPTQSALSTLLPLAQRRDARRPQ